MPGPLGHGVLAGLGPARRRRGARRPGPGRSWSYFFLISLSLAWITAGLVGRPDLGEGTEARLLRASLYYGAVMGWPPVVAAWIARWGRDERAPAGLRGAPARELGLALVVALGLIAAATGVGLLAGDATRHVLALPRGASATVVVVATLAVLALQALAEEYGWRGSPLAWAVERWGARAGLVVHEVAWGVWYAPLFVVSSAPPSTTLPTAAGFALTCALLGVVLGWLRLRTGSVLPSSLTNALLTLLAGLPLVLYDAGAGAAGAVFGWPGWPVLGGLALIVLVWRGRDLTRA